jgi:hypothetical protein
MRGDPLPVALFDRSAPALHDVPFLARVGCASKERDVIGDRPFNPFFSTAGEENHCS